MSDSPAANEHFFDHLFARPPWPRHLRRTEKMLRIADSSTANEQKSEQQRIAAFESLPYRRRIFHSFREAGEQKALPGNAF